MNSDLEGQGPRPAHPELFTNAAGEPLVAVDRQDGIAVVTLNRPERRNAWIEALELAFYAAVDRCADDPEVRVLIVTGSGRDFSPGMDRSRLLAITQRGDTYGVRSRRPTILRDTPKPVIAAVDGACAGVGLTHALMADVRVTTDRSTWSTAFTRIGLVAEDGLARRLRDVVGVTRATELLLTSRRVGGVEAVDIGLATHLADGQSALDRAREVARDFLGLSASSMAITKWQITQSDGQSLDEAILLAAASLRVAKARPDYQEGVLALVEGRPPSFPGIGRETWSDIHNSIDELGPW